MLSGVRVASAHKVSIYGYAEGGTVYTESYFAGGGQCIECTVLVKDVATGEDLFSGRTDKDGHFDFENRWTNVLELIVDAGGGHRGTYILSEELKNSNTNLQKEDALESPEEKASQPAPSGMDAEIEKHLEPLRHELTKLRERTERPGITEVLGGIGYIMGLLGLWAYMKSREKKR